jgi:hypothetical protein
MIKNLKLISLFFLMMLLICVPIFGYYAYTKGAFTEPSIDLKSIYIPTQVYNQDNIKFKTLNEKVIINNQEYKNDGGMIKYPLKAGKNEINIQAINSWGKKGAIKSYIIENIKNEWNNATCNGLQFILNTDQLQYGYNGIVDDNNPANQIRYDDIKKNDTLYKSLKQFNCTSDGLQLKTHATIYPKDTKANCWNCDGNNDYINITSTPKLINSPAPEIIDDSGNLRKESIYSSKSGIEYRLSEVKAPDSSSLNYNAQFDFNSRNYEISGKVFSKEKQDAFIANFFTVLDNIYIMNQDSNYSLEINKDKKTLTFNDVNAASFQFNYPSKWELLGYYQPTVKIDNVDSKPVYNINLQKGDYQISMTLNSKDSPITIGASIANTEDIKYEKIEVEGKKIEVPKAFNIPPAGIYNTSSSDFVRVDENKPIEVNGKPGKSYTGVIETNNKKVVISLRYIGLDYKIQDGDAVRNTSSLDDNNNKEILDIIKSIKWGE